MWPDTGTGETAASEPSSPAKVKKPKTARGFKTLKGVTVGTVIADAVNQVTILSKGGQTYFVIEADVVNGVATLKCKKHKAVKYKRPTTRSAPPINKFAT